MEEARDSRTAAFERKRPLAEFAGDGMSGDSKRREHSYLSTIASELSSEPAEIAGHGGSKDIAVAAAHIVAPSMSWNAGTKSKIRATFGKAPVKPIGITNLGSIGLPIPPLPSSQKSPRGGDQHSLEQPTTEPEILSRLVADSGPLDPTALSCKATSPVEYSLHALRPSVALVSSRSSDIPSSDGEVIESEDDFLLNLLSREHSVDKRTNSEGQPVETSKDGEGYTSRDEGEVDSEDSNEADDIMGGDIMALDGTSTVREAESSEEHLNRGSTYDHENEEIVEGNDYLKALPDLENVLHHDHDIKLSISTSRETTMKLTLADLSTADLREQIRYFYVTRDPNFIALSEPVRCLVCAKAGHNITDCEALTCNICRMQNDHFTNQCPTTRKCAKCRAVGHDKNACPYKLRRLAPFELLCELCLRTGHVEDDCELLWRTSGRPWASDSPPRSIAVYCYECGDTGHLGNDCPRRMPGKSMGSSTWSLRSSYAASNSQSSKQGGLKIKGYSQQSRRFEDEDDGKDGSFIRPRVPQPSTHGRIGIANNIMRPRSPSRSQMTGGRGIQDGRWPANRGTRNSGEYGRDSGASRYGNRAGISQQQDSDTHLPHFPKGPRLSRKGGRDQPSGPNTYRPMPSAASNAWKKSRT
ncbi:hypothetical protein MMC19_001156 [Ptychographa xylographoides]|nr:hypothetical protein [Ptychographa xylographoides]